MKANLRHKEHCRKSLEGHVEGPLLGLLQRLCLVKPFQSVILTYPASPKLFLALHKAFYLSNHHSISQCSGHYLLLQVNNYKENTRNYPSLAHTLICAIKNLYKQIIKYKHENHVFIFKKETT